MLGNKQFELTNHLGNVLATITDRKIAHETTPGSGTIGYYTADISSAQDYYAGGMLMPGRNFSSNSYKFGYQGSMKDDEIAGVTDANITTEFRELDTRTLRWWAIDPKAKDSPWESPYISMGDNPIWHNDILGDDWWVTNDGTLINFKNSRKVPIEYKEKNMTWVGRDKFFGKGIVIAPVTVIETSKSEAFANAHGFKIVPTQTVECINKTSQDYPDLHEHIEWGDKIAINEKYDVVKQDAEAVNTSTHVLNENILSSKAETLLGVKRSETIIRNYYKYERPEAHTTVGKWLLKIADFIKGMHGDHNMGETGGNYSSWNKYKETGATKLKGWEQK